MEIEYKGSNAIVIKTKNATVAIDPLVSLDGGKDVSIKAGVYIATQEKFAVTPGDDTFLIDMPGEYEIKGLSVKGIPTRAYMDTPEAGSRATMYRIDSGEVSLVVVGHTSVPLSEEQLEAIGVVDIAIIPVGGNGYTLDAHAAVQLVRQIDPKLVIPTHYNDDGLHYEVEQAELEPFLKELGSATEVLPKLKIKGAITNEVLSVAILEKVT